MFATTTFSVTNYSGFTAKRVGVDLRYVTWIGEWLKADEEERPEGALQGPLPGEVYPSAPHLKLPKIDKLKPGETKVQGVMIGGQFDLEKEVCSKGEDGKLVYVRVRWENEDRRVFDEVHEYKLICTTSGEGRAFTFIPQGIISRKDKFK